MLSVLSIHPHRKLQFYDLLFPLRTAKIFSSVQKKRKENQKMCFEKRNHFTVILRRE